MAVVEHVLAMEMDSHILGNLLILFNDIEVECQLRGNMRPVQ
jgi:hypothetical protein